MNQTSKYNFNIYLEQIKKLNILVIGDIMIDKWEYFKSVRLSQEAPVPIVIPEKKEEYVLGGAGNVAKNLDLLGANVYLFSLIGNDKYSDLLINDLIKKQSNIKFHFVSDSRVNTIKQRLIVDNQHFLRIDSENTKDISGYVYNEFIKNINNIFKLEKFDAVILQDYNKGLLSDNAVSFIINKCIANNIKVYIDPKKIRYFEGAWLLKPNKKEFFELTNIDINKNNYDKYSIGVYDWMHVKNVNNLLITLSEDGMVFYGSNGNITYFNEKFIFDNTVDVTGAGDIVIALYTALDLLKNVSEYEKLYYTSLASQTAITKRGTSIFSLNEISKYI